MLLVSLDSRSPAPPSHSFHDRRMSNGLETELLCVDVYPLPTLSEYVDFTSRLTTDSFSSATQGFSIAGWTETMKVSLAFSGTEKLRRV